MKLNKFNLALLLVAGMYSMNEAQVKPTPKDSLDSKELEEVVVVGRGVIDLVKDRKTPVAVNNISRTEIQNKAVGNVEFPEMLKNTPSIYIANQSGGFGDSSVYVRGFDQTNTAFMLNGQPINGMEDGKMYWSNWAGISDIANAVQIQRGLGASKLAISSVGGTVNIITKATEKQKGGFARFMVGNDSYLKGTIGYNTGLVGKWGFSFMLDHWQAHRKYARGTEGQGQNYFFSVGYKPNENHNFNFMIFGAPQYHDQNYSKPLTTVYNANGSVKTQGYDIHDEKWNSNYGFLDGKYKNLRRNYYHKPVANLNWDWTINNKMNLSSVLYASIGRGGGTGGLGATSNLTPDGLVDFDKIYSNNLAGTSKGIIRSSVNNHMWYGNVTNFNYNIDEHLSFNVGADVRFYKGDHFQEVVDLLGLNSWSVTKANDGAVATNITKTFSANPWSSLFSFAKEKDRVGYDYSEWINYQGGFGQIEYKNSFFSVYAQGAISTQNYKREDRWNNPHTYAGGSVAPKKGKSTDKSGYNVKGGFAFNIDKANSVYFNAGFYSRQPFMDNVFQGTDDGGRSDNTYLRNPKVDNEEITGYEAGYKFQKSNVNVSVNLYSTKWSNRFLAVTNQTYNGDQVDYLYTGVSQIHKGIEVDFNTRPIKEWMVRGYVSYGDWKYDGSANYQIRRESDYIYVGTGSADLHDAKVGDAAQTSFGLGSAIDIVKGLSFDFDLNYYARVYPTLTPKSALSLSSQQTPLDPYALVDAGLTYIFKFGAQNLKFRANAYNVFNTPYTAQINGSNYYLGNGRTWNAAVTYQF